MNAEQSQIRSNKSFFAFLLLWLFGGLLGAHRWYAGVGSWVYTLTLGYLGFGWLIDFVIMVTGGLNDDEGKPIWIRGKTEQTLPSTIDKPKTRLIWLGLPVLQIIILLFIVPSLFPYKPNELGAVVMCEEFIKDNLKAPSTAEFESIFSRDVERLTNENQFRVQMYVDAENGFGANIRSEWLCYVSYVGDETWHLDSLEELD
jgi:hypothetical protein